MMAIDPNAFRNAYNASYEAGTQPLHDFQSAQMQRRQQETFYRQAALQDRQIAQQDAAIAKEAAAEERRMTIGSMLARGDRSGGQRAALESGDVDFATRIAEMGDAERKQITEVSRATAPVMLQLKNYPQEQRSAILARLAPELMARGLTEEQIARADLSDAGLDLLGANAMTIAEYNSAREARDRLEFDRGKEARAARVADARLGLDREKLGVVRQRLAGGGSAAVGADDAYQSEYGYLLGGN